MTPGGKRLVILGVASILIALITSGVSLAFYHNSGDIYLDRSRPGFLPDEKEAASAEKTEDYAFPDSGDSISPEELEKYLEKLSETEDRFDSIPDPFSADSLSDEALNISK